MFEKSIYTNNFDDFFAAKFILNNDLPFCFGFPFAPEYDFQGNLLLPDPKEDWEAAIAYAGTLANEAIFLVCGFQRNSANGVRKFVESTTHIPVNFVGSSALHLALEYAENTFFRKSWIDNLDEFTKYSMKAQFFSSTPGVLDGSTSKILKLPDYVKIGSKFPAQMLS